MACNRFVIIGLLLGCHYALLGGAVFGDEKTVRKARCYAHCNDLISESSGSDPNCFGKQCRQCRSSCENFINVSDCRLRCNLTSMCNSSCEFQGVMRNWSSVLVGGKGFLSAPSQPIANLTISNATTLMLSWQPPTNASGSVMYLLKKRHTDNNSIRGQIELGKVFSEPKALITLHDICNQVITPTETDRPFKFYFIVVALTADSSVVAGAESSAIAMPRVAPITNITAMFSYNKNAPTNDKLKVDVSVLPPLDYANAITSYAVDWRMSFSHNCQPYVAPRTTFTQGPSTSFSFHIYPKLKECEHTLKVYSLAKCILSQPKIHTYLYKGCRFVSNYNQNECYKFDPPPTNASERKVRNLSYTSLSISRDYTFITNITWSPPLYPYAEVVDYVMFYGDRDAKVWGYWAPAVKQKRTTSLHEYVAGVIIKPDMPFRFKITPSLEWGSETNVWGEESNIYFTAPGLPKEDLLVRYISTGEFKYLGSFTLAVNVSWIKPLFNYSSITNYVVEYTKGSNLKTTYTTKNAQLEIGLLQHKEPFFVEIKAVYKHDWIKTNFTKASFVAPTPNKEDIKVQNLMADAFIEDTTSNLFSVMFRWAAPSLRPVDIYDVSYSITGYPILAKDCPSSDNHTICQATTTTNTTYTLHGIHPREHVMLQVTPRLNTIYISGLPTSKQVDAPIPHRESVRVRRLTYRQAYNVPSTNPPNSTNATTTVYGNMDIIFVWEPPSFKHSGVKYYDIKYNIEKYSQQQSKISKRAVINSTQELFENTTTSTNFTVLPLENDQQMTFKVNPVFDVAIIVGESSQVTITKLDVESPSPGTTGLSTGLSTLEVTALTVSIIAMVALVLILTMWYVEKRRINAKRGFVGSNGAIIDQWEVAWDNVIIDEELGEGAFGKVFKGTLMELPEQSSKFSIARSMRRKSTTRFSKPVDGYVVAIKILHDTAGDEQRTEFLKEIRLMKEVGSHRNIVNMFGCCTIMEPMFLIVEYLPNGDLLHYLRARRGKINGSSENRDAHHSTYCQTYYNQMKTNQVGEPTSQTGYMNLPPETKKTKTDGIELLSAAYTGDRNKDSERTGESNEGIDDENDDDYITPGDMMAFAWQVSQGMEYLAKKGYVHRDLAARNVLVGEKKVAKVADFGLTRHMYEDLYQGQTSRKLPLKWMSVEAIFDQSFTSQSDVWAYGVFLWELVTLGGTPYPTVNNRELLRILKEGYRMEQPETCSDEMYKIMQSCWRESPNDRPTFEKIHETLEELMMRDNPYFDPGAVDESRDYYNVPSFNSAPEPDESDDVLEVVLGKSNQASYDSGSPESVDTLDSTFCFENTLGETSEINFKNVNSAVTNECLTCDNSGGESVQICAEKKEVEKDEEEKDKMEVNLEEVEPIVENDCIMNSNSPSKGVDKKSLKYAQLDFDAMELQLYRRRYLNHGPVL